MVPSYEPTSLADLLLFLALVVLVDYTAPLLESLPQANVSLHPVLGVPDEVSDLLSPESLVLADPLPSSPEFPSS